MDMLLFQMLPVLVVIAILLANARPRCKCPDCGALLPQLCSPFRKTRRMWISGGYLCAKCGCETDRAGEKIRDGDPVPVPAARWMMLAVALFVGTGLFAALLSIGRQRIESMPPIAPPQQASLVSSVH